MNFFPAARERSTDGFFNDLLMVAAMSWRHTFAGLLGCLLLAAPFALAGEMTPPAPTVWNVREAVRAALRNNPDSMIGQSRIEAAQATIAIGKAAFYPQLDVTSHYSQTNTPMYSFGNILNQGMYSQAIDFNNPGRTDNLNAGLRLGYRFFNGGRDWAGLKAAEAQGASAERELAAVRAQLAFEVVRAFHLILQGEGVVAANEAAVEAITASLAVAQARHGEGVLLKADLLDLVVQQARARENLIQARHALDLARKIFLNLLGRKEGEVAIDQASGESQEIPQSVSYDQRPELQGTEALVRAARARVRQASGGYYPVIDGYAGYGVDQGHVMDGSNDSWEAGVKLQYNLFDGRRTSSEVARAEAMLAETLERKRKIELAIGLEVKQAGFALKESEERLRVTEQSAAQARESARINRLRFGEGVLLSADLIGVENRLTEALVRRIVAETAHRIAIADLRRALGLPQFPEEPAAPAVGKASLHN